jgi:hypothetical protein
MATFYPVPNPKQKHQLLKSRLVVMAASLAALAGVSMASGSALSTGITVVSYAEPSRVSARIPGASLSSLTALAGTSRASSSLPGATLDFPVETFDMGSGVARASGSLPSANFQSLFPAAASRASARLPSSAFSSLFPAAPARASGTLQSGALKSIIGGGASRASSAVPGSTLKSLHDASESIGTARVSAADLHSRIDNVSSSRASARLPGAALDVPVVNFQLVPTPSKASALLPGSTLIQDLALAATVRGQARNTAQLGMTNFQLGSAISRAEGRARSTSITMVSYATPSRAVPRANAVQLRFVGAGFEMGSGLSRAAGRARSAVSLTNIFYCTPIKGGTGRVSGAIQLWYDAVPIRGFGLARCVETLRLDGQLRPTIARHVGARVLSTNIRMMSAVGAARDTARAVGVLQFAGGSTQALAGRSRSTGKAHALQMQTVSGLVTPLGTAHIRDSGRLRGQLITYYTCTPVKADPRVRGTLETHNEVAPVRHAGRVMPAVLSITNKQFLNGRSRASERLRASLITRVQLTGSSRASSRLTAPGMTHRLVLQLAPSRDVGVIHCSPLAFLPPNFVEIGTGTARSTGRLLAATLNHTHAAAPSIATSRVSGAALNSTVTATGTSRAAEMANAQLTFQGPFVLPLNGQVFASSRSTGDIHISLAGGICLMAGRVVCATPSFAVALGNSIKGHPRAYGVLAFTGSVVQPVSGQSTSAGPRLTAQLSTLLGTSRSAAHPKLSAELTVRQPLAGTVQAHALLTGLSFSNPSVSTSLCSSRVSSGHLVSALPLDAGASRDTGRLRGTLTIPSELPHLIFQARVRTFAFLAKQRVFLVAAKDRIFIVPAGRGET